MAATIRRPAASCASVSTPGTTMSPCSRKCVRWLSVIMPPVHQRIHRPAIQLAFASVEEGEHGLLGGGGAEEAGGQFGQVLAAGINVGEEGAVQEFL